MCTRVLFFLMLALPASFAWAQDISIRLLDKTNLQPISGVAVSYINEANAQVMVFSDGKGQARLPMLKGEVVIQAVGYLTRKQSAEALKQNPVVYLNEQLNSLDEVVVSASRFEETKRDVAQQIYTMNKKEIAFLNQGSTADLLQQSGQVLVQKSQGGGGSPIMRGFEANKVLMVVDGIRMNNAIYRGGHLQNIVTLDQAVLERTELVFGAGAVVYGSDALGGVMHFHTRKPQFDKIGANAYLRYASAASEQVGHAGWNIGFKRLAFVGGFTSSDFGDVQMGNIRNDAYGNWGKRFKYAERINGQDTEVTQENTNLQKNSGYKQIDFLQKVAVKINDNITNTVNFQYSTSTDIPRYDRLSEISNNKLRFAQWYYGPQKRVLIANHLEWKNMGFADLGKLTLAYQDIEESRHDRRFNNPRLNHRTEKVKVLTANIDFSKQIHKSELRYGADFAHNQVISTAFAENIVTNVISPLNTRYPDGGSKMSSFAGYFTHTFELSKKFITTQGLRYSKVDLESKFVEKSFFPFPFSQAKQNNQALNGNVGVIFMPVGEWRFALNASTGFRAPNVDDIGKVFDSTTGSATTTGTLVVPNPDIKPEKTTNIELSIRNKFFNMLTLEAVAYNTWYQNAITVQPFALNGQSTTTYGGFPANIVANQNSRKAYIRGLFVQAVAELNEYVTFTSSLTYTYARIQDATLGEIPLDHIPPMFGKSAFRINTKRVQTEIYALYNGWKRLQNYASFSGNEDNIQYATQFGMPAWVTMNLRTSYQFTKYTQLQIALENIFDQHYRTFASGISGAGRNFIMTIRGNF